MKPNEKLLTVQFETLADWETWLEANHMTSGGVWIKLAKKETGVRSVSYAEALDAAICYGWIDGQKASFDDSFWLQKFTRRGPKSKWSKLNREKAMELTAQGRMKPAGLKEVEAAKRDGRWDKAYASQRNMAVPEDLQKRLNENPRAGAFFAGLDSRNRYAILYRIHDAKKPDTRARRIERFVEMLNEGKRIY